MTTISDEDLLAYADEQLDVQLATEVESQLRSDEKLRERFRQLLEQRDSGAVTVGEVWRHERLSCPRRSELGLYLMQALETRRRDYITFHLEMVGCVYCRAILEELREAAAELQQEEQSHERLERLFASSAGFLRKKST